MCHGVDGVEGKKWRAWNFKGGNKKGDSCCLATKLFRKKEGVVSFTSLPYRKLDEKPECSGGDFGSAERKRGRVEQAGGA